MAGTKVRGITIELSANATGVSNALKSVNSSISSTGKELKDINKLLKLDPSNVELLAQKHQALQRQITNTNQKLDLLKKAEEDLKAQMVDGGTEEQQRQLAALQREIISTEKNLDKYTAQLDETGKETRELTKDEKAAEQATGQMKEGFTVLKGALASLVADGIRKAADAFKDLMTAGPAFADDILTMASTTSLATDTLQEFSYMSGLVDVEVSTVAGSLKKLTKNMSTASKGTGDAYNSFKELGVSVTDVNGNLRNNEEVFYEVIDALGKMENETQRDAHAMNIFGKSATDLNPLIEAGSEQLNKFKQEAHDMGYVLDGNALKALGRVQDAFDRFQGKTTSIKNQVAAGLAPAMERAMTRVAKVLDSIDWNKVGKDIGAAFEKLIDVFDWILKNAALIKAGLTGIVTAMATAKVLNFVSSVQALIQGLQGAQVAQKGLNAAMNANPYMLMITAIVALGAALISWQKSLAEAQREADVTWRATDRLTQAAADQVSAIEELTSSYDEMKAAREDTLNAGLSELAHVETLYDELKNLADANGVVADSDKARAEFILGELNNALGTEYTMTGNIINRYADLSNAINDVIAKKKAEIILAAQEEAYRQALVGRADAERALAQAQADRMSIQDQIAANEARINELMSATGPQLAANATEMGKLHSQNQELNTSLSELNIAYQTAADTVDQYAYDVTTYENNMTQSLMGNYDQIAYKSWETAKAQGEATQQASQEVVKNAIAAKDSWMGNLSQMLSETTGRQIEFKDAGNGMVQAYIDGEKAGEPMAKNNMKEFGRALVRQIQDEKSAMAAAGRSLNDGVADGIAGNQSRALGNISSFASSILSRFKSTLGIKSPSRAMIEAMGYVVDGVVVGLDRNEDRALNRVDEFGEDIADKMTTAMDVAPNIKPIKYDAVVNGTGIAQTANNTNSEMSQVAALLNRYLPELANRDIVLDSGETVGALAPKMDAAFGRMQTLRARRV